MPRTPTPSKRPGGTGSVVQPLVAAREAPAAGGRLAVRVRSTSARAASAPVTSSSAARPRSSRCADGGGRAARREVQRVHGQLERRRRARAAQHRQRPDRGARAAGRASSTSPEAKKRAIRRAGADERGDDLVDRGVAVRGDERRVGRVGVGESAPPPSRADASSAQDRARRPRSRGGRRRRGRSSPRSREGRSGRSPGPSPRRGSRPRRRAPRGRGRRGPARTGRRGRRRRGAPGHPAPPSQDRAIGAVGRRSPSLGRQGPMAQLVEQRPYKAKVGSSSLSGSTGGTPRERAEPTSGSMTDGPYRSRSACPSARRRRAPLLLAGALAVGPARRGRPATRTSCGCRS